MLSAEARVCSPSSTLDLSVPALMGRGRSVILYAKARGLKPSHPEKFVGHETSVWEGSM